MSQNDCQLDYKLMTKDKIQEAMMIQAETMKQECLAIGMGMFEEPGAPEEIQLLFREIIKDGSTIVAVDKQTGELGAVAFTKIHARPREGVKDPLDDFIGENLKKKSCQELVKFLGDLESSVDIFEKYNVDGAMELFYLGTNPRYQGRGIGCEIVKKCIEFARGLENGTTKRSPIDNETVNEEVIPKLIFGVFLSNYSQRIADKLNFETIREVRYEDFIIGGRKLSERIGDTHKTARLQVLKL
ncbi:uncharacterized protein LOC116426032 [Nomia melanderi]|uniref:uncharacterized protein LOC116426032 n=1 Tax=Nomia melanderi TaxID=2448451 RepID=UPI001304642C|nr:uncharacterized protein LOC116426032 [Nomia melanderi]XP_031830341.1 uncharacterized protein LOC116426032 [Nomia melanderi]